MTDDKVLQQIREQLHTANLIAYYTGILRAKDVRETVEKRLGVSDQS